MSEYAQRLMDAAISIYEWAECAPTSGAPPQPGSPSVTADGLMALAEALGEIIGECQSALDYADERGPAFRLAQHVMERLDEAL